MPRIGRREQQAFQFALGYNMSNMHHGHDARDIEDCRRFAKWFDELAQHIQENAIPANAYAAWLTNQQDNYRETMILARYPFGLPCKCCGLVDGQHKFSCTYARQVTV